MELTDDDVLQILKLLEQSSFDELQLEMKGLKLVVRRGGAGAPSTELASAPKPGLQKVKPVPKAPATIAACDVPSGNVLEAPVTTPDEAGLVVITAPNVGTFYRAPKPGAPPFVEVGKPVSEDDTVCLLEVMKCFISVKAKTKGKIAKVCVENAQMVEFGQKLFLVKPD